MGVHSRRGMIGTAVLTALSAAFVLNGVAGRVGAWPDPSNPTTSLGDVEAAVLRRYPVPELTSEQRKSLMESGDVVLLDVREPAEFDVSHIRAARRIDPGLPADSFVALAGNDIKGKKIVLYCSVGVRSGEMLQVMQSTLKEKGAAAAFNLRGGIFRWYARGGEVVSSAGPVHKIHPYDSSWRQLLVRTVAMGTGVGR